MIFPHLIKFLSYLVFILCEICSDDGIPAILSTLLYVSRISDFLEKVSPWKSNLIIVLH